MSIAKSKFIVKHEALIVSLKAQYSTYGSFDSELELANSSIFPSIGVFLGVSSSNSEIIKYKPMTYSYILGVFDRIDLSNSSDALIKQKDLFSLIENIIETMGYRVVGDIEPLTEVAINEGSFISGWTVPIQFNA